MNSAKRGFVLKKLYWHLKYKNITKQNLSFHQRRFLDDRRREGFESAISEQDSLTFFLKKKVLIFFSTRNINLWQIWETKLTSSFTKNYFGTKFSD